MKTLTTKILLLLCLATASGLAGADNLLDARRGFQTVVSVEWQLGDFRGSNRGYEILYRDSGRGRWRSAPGYAMAIGDGWVLGTDRHRGGYGIYRWSGRGWTRMPGSAVRIGGSYQQPWVINDLGIRFIWNGNDWREDRDNRDRESRGYRRDDHWDRDDDHDWRDRDNDHNRRGNVRRNRDRR
jgi:hypothetical protein